PEFVTANQYVAPRNEIEAGICDIWQQVLGVKQVGITDNFFALGGNSINATMLRFKLARTLEIDLPLRTLFDYPKIETLSTNMKLYDAPEAVTVADSPAIVRGFPMSIMQKSLWFIQQMTG